MQIRSMGELFRLASTYRKLYLELHLDKTNEPRLLFYFRTDTMISPTQNIPQHC